MDQIVVSPATREAARAADLFAQLMSKTFCQRILAEMPEAREMELTLAQLEAMRYVWRHENVLMGMLAAGLEISYPSATNMAKRLEEKGLVRRMINPEDRREVAVILTERGSALTAAIEHARIARFAHLLERLAEPERAAFLEMLRHFILLAVEDNPCTADEICLRCGRLASNDCPLAEIIPLFACK